MHVGLKSYDSKEWRFFTDSSKRSLKCVLLRNGNKFAAVPIGYSTSLKKQYQNVKLVMDKIAYFDHNWIICVDLHMVNFLLRQQSGYTKLPRFLCQWDSKDDKKHWQQKEWPIRESLVVGGKNVILEPLVSRDRIIFPPLHIKQGLLKQFIKPLDKLENVFVYYESLSWSQ